MIRVYCDQCDKELQKAEGARLITRYGKMTVEVMTGAKGGAMNGGNWCHECVREAVASTGPRRKGDEG